MYFYIYIIKNLFIMNAKQSIISLFLTLLLPITITKAQVSIGSENEPREGILLDLKENNNNANNANVNAGLGLPRVALMSATILMVDNENQKDRYTGLTVYNVTNNRELQEGIYIWDGTRWKRVITVDGYGTDGQALINQGNGTYKWSSIPLPEFEFHKPSQISMFDPTKTTEHIYSYMEINNNSITGPTVVEPVASLFDGHYVYTDDIKFESGLPHTKFLLMGITVLLKVKTIGNILPLKAFSQTVKIDVIVDDIIRETLNKQHTTSANGSLESYIDLFTIVPLPSMNPGTYNMKIKVSTVKHSFPLNMGSSPGNFRSTESGFYEISIKDVNYIVYETD